MPEVARECAADRASVVSNFSDLGRDHGGLYVVAGDVFVDVHAFYGLELCEKGPVVLVKFSSRLGDPIHLSIWIGLNEAIPNAVDDVCCPSHAKVLFANMTFPVLRLVHFNRVGADVGLGLCWSVSDEAV